MSSWFGSFFRRNSTILEEDDPNLNNQNEEATEGDLSGQPSTSTATSDQFTGVSNMPNLTSEQKEHIREVMQRAERSNLTAKIVMDSRRLKNVQRASSTSPLRDHRKKGRIRPQRGLPPEGEEAGDEDEDLMDIVQMESLPENIEITVGPSCSSYMSSYANSELGSVSDREELMDREDTIPLDDTTELIQDENSLLTEHQPINIARSMQLLSQKIAQWIKSLDEEDDYVTPLAHSGQKTTASKDENGKHLETVQECSAQIELLNEKDCQPLLDYCSFVSLNICILAVSEAQTSSQNYELEQQLEDIARQLVSTVLNRVVQEEWLAHFSCSILEKAVKEVGRHYLTPLQEEEEEVELLSSYTILVETASRLPSPGPSEKIGTKFQTQLEHVDKKGSNQEEGNATCSSNNTQLTSSNTDEVKENIEEEQPNIDISSVPIAMKDQAALEEQVDFTQEDMEHIKRIQRMAKKGLFKPKFKAPTSSIAKKEVDAAKDQPKFTQEKVELTTKEIDRDIIMTGESSFQEVKSPVAESIVVIGAEDIQTPCSSHTSGADQPNPCLESNLFDQQEIENEENSSRTSSADSMNHEEASQEPDMPCSPLKSESIFTQEELEHIDRIRRLAEESSFEQVKYDLPTAVVQKETSRYARSSHSPGAENPPSSYEDLLQPSPSLSDHKKEGTHATTKQNPDK
uniref:Uncharacterized protein n=1 Tax=Ditylenchus dipsaci TaxID=166011 RepID=A0A915CSZ8_9BILA